MQINLSLFNLSALALCSLILGCAPATFKESTQARQQHLGNELAATEIPGVHLSGARKADIQASPSCPDKSCPGLGNSFYLPSVNALSINTGGNIFFKNRKLGECAQLSVATQAERQFFSANSMENFINNTMASADLSGSYKTAALTAKGTAQAMTNTSSEITTNFNSTTLDINIVTHAVDFLQNSSCFNEANIDPTLLTAFHALAPIDPAQVGDSASWSPYAEFLKTNGSHIMMQQQIGSRFQQWESTTSEAKDIQETLKAKACAEVEGPSAGGGWSVQGCAAYSQEEKQKAYKITTTSKNVVMGGSRQTRTGLAKKVTEDSLNAFIDSAEEGDQPIRFVFKPIWQLLSYIYTPACASDGKDSKACQNLQRVYNLQASYEGWTAVGCPLMKDGRGSAYQTMAIAGTTSQGINTYECLAAKTGCRDKADCSAGGAQTQCYCHGPGCIDTGPMIDGTKLFRNKVRGEKEGKFNAGVNNSCYWKLAWEKSCFCKTNWSGGLLERRLYSQ